MMPLWRKMLPVLLTAAAVLCPPSVTAIHVPRMATVQAHSTGTHPDKLGEPEYACKPWKVAPELQCQYLSDHANDCTVDGLISYLQIHYCIMAGRPLLSGLAFSLWIAVLFGLLLTTAERFFCPSLELISEYLKLSPAVAGATLLALGNGAPDIFTQLASISTGGGDAAAGVSMTLSEPLGSGMFVACVVFAGVILASRTQRTVQVRPNMFMKDILFYLGATILLMALLLSGQVALWQCLGLALYYALYVVVTLWMSRAQGDVLVHKDTALHEVPYEHMPDSDDDDEEEDALLEQGLLEPLITTCHSAPFAHRDNEPGSPALGSNRRTSAGPNYLTSFIYPHTAGARRRDANIGSGNTNSGRRGWAGRSFTKLFKVHKSASAPEALDAAAADSPLVARGGAAQTPAPAAAAAVAAGARPAGGSEKAEQHLQTVAVVDDSSDVKAGSPVQPAAAEALTAASASSRAPSLPAELGSALKPEAAGMVGESGAASDKTGRDFDGQTQRRAASPLLPPLWRPGVGVGRKLGATAGAGDGRSSTDNVHSTMNHVAQHHLDGSGALLPQLQGQQESQMGSTNKHVMNGENGGQEHSTAILGHSDHATRQHTNHVSFSSGEPPQLTAAAPHATIASQDNTTSPTADEGGTASPPPGTQAPPQIPPSNMETSLHTTPSSIAPLTVSPFHAAAFPLAADGGAGGYNFLHKGGQDLSLHAAQSMATSYMSGTYSSVAGGGGHRARMVHHSRTLKRTLERPVMTLLSITMPRVNNNGTARFEKTYAVLLPILLPVLISLYNGWVPSLHWTAPSRRLIMAASPSIILSAFLLFFFPANGRLHGRWLAVGTILTFTLAMGWLDVAANELVNLVQALGVIWGCRPALLSTTLLSWGNSVPDLISNVSLSADGYPTMAITACFASPIFTLLMGVVSSLTYGAWLQPLKLPDDLSLRLLDFSAMVMLLQLAITVPFVFHYNLDWRTALMAGGFYAFFQAVYVLTMLGKLDWHKLW